MTGKRQFGIPLEVYGFSAKERNGDKLVDGPFESLGFLSVMEHLVKYQPLVKPVGLSACLYHQRRYFVAFVAFFSFSEVVIYSGREFRRIMGDLATQRQRASVIIVMHENMLFL